jgi:5-methylcytosine-specific restriction endonuclease McrA
MEFKLEPYRRNISEENLLKDLIEVSKRLGKDCIGEREYNANGQYSSGTFGRRFGSWSKALEKAGLKPNNWQNVTDDDYIKDIQHVAKRLGKNSVTQAEYNDLGKYSASAINSRFKTWLKALAIAGLQKTRNIGVTEEEYFINLESVWRNLGRQPTTPDMRKPLSLYSVDAYADRFGTWRKALEAFVNYINQEPVAVSLDESENRDATIAESQTSQPEKISKRSRHISWRLRFLVMRRDGFRCCKCGRSPANEPGVILHVDHDKAWIKGGPNNYENLRTLCLVCNIGKSDLDSEAPV